MTTFLICIHLIAGLLAIPLIMLHKGSGNGLTDTLGTSTTNSLLSSSVAETNLRRLTATLIGISAFAAVALALYSANF